MLLKLSIPADMFLLVSILTVLAVPWGALTQLVVPNTTGSSRTYREVLDASRNLSLQWTVDISTRRITFQVETRPEGYLALGLTRTEELENVDVIAVGINNGAPYVHDMFGRSNVAIARDASQDWRILGTLRSPTGQVSIQIQRSFDPCDGEDLPFTGSLSHLHWEFGANHNVPTSFQPEGLAKMYYLDPPVLPITSTAPQTETRLFRLMKSFRLPPRRTSYWCSIHKMTPTLSGVHHIVGFDAYFANNVSKAHVHHQLVYRCSLPPGIDPATVFQRFVDYPGEECYLSAQPQIPSEYCREAVVVWAVGAKPVLLPESVGIPMGETRNEYYMLETHYNNPEERADVDVVNGIDILYTPQRRPNDASILILGYGVLGTFVIPPNVADFNIMGHCTKSCSTQMFPTTANIIGLAVHGHIQARKMRFRHFRNTVELPWVINDEGYDFDYQQLRMLQNPVTIRPGDHMAMQCSFDTRNRNGSAIESGYSTLSEMCVSFLIIDKKLQHPFCASEYPVKRTMERYGITNMTWDPNTAERVVRAANNRALVGESLINVVKNDQVWTPQQVAQLEREQMFGLHQENCPPGRLLSGAWYYVTLLQAVTGGLIPLPILGRSTPATLQTPVGSPIPVAFPAITSVYSPPQQCLTPAPTFGPPTDVVNAAANAIANALDRITSVIDRLRL